VDESFAFFHKLGDSRIKHNLYVLAWKEEDYRCANFKRKYIVAYLDLDDEVIICDFALQKLFCEGE